MHGSVADLLYSFVKDAGYSARREAVVPEWAHWSTNRNGERICTEAVLDIVATKPHTAEAFFLDVTVRNPLAARYLRGDRGLSSSNTSGFACDVADHEKHQRYPSMHGLCCTPFSLEVFGRVSQECVNVLESLAASAAARAASRALPPRAWMKHWLQKLSCTVQRSLAQNVLDSIGQHARDP